MDELKKHLEADMSDEEKRKLKEELEAPINRDSDNQSIKGNNINDSIHSVVGSYCSMIDEILNDCLEPVAGMGCTEYRIHGKMLYYKIKASNELMKKMYKS